jgi:NAD(P)-dependent dehydrogenase (short-subunit alcohol dehydrogenase family)
VVTGAGGLLGRQHVAVLAEAGATVLAVDRDAERLELLPDNPTDGGEVIPVVADTADRDGLEHVRGVIGDRTGRLDALINNAAIDDKIEGETGDREPIGFEDYPLDLWRRVLDVNVTGVFLACQVLGRMMADARSGSVINVASTYGLVAPDPALYVRPDGVRSFVKSAAYPTSKGAVIALTRYLAAYWGSTGVRVNALAPGGVANGQPSWFRDAYARRTPLGRMAAPDDYRGALLFLASDASRYMTGTTLVVDGGFTTW